MQIWKLYNLITLYKQKRKHKKKNLRENIRLDY